MESLSAVNIGVGLLGVAAAIAKVAFLVWLSIRTRRPAVIVYVLYGVAIALLNPVINAAVGQSPEGLEQVEVAMSRLLIVRTVTGLVETGLFIWLLWPLRNRIRPADEA